MDQFEKLILHWISLFEDFIDYEYSNISSLIKSSNFKNLVNDVFCFKPSIFTTEDDRLYNTIKINYQEFEVQQPLLMYTEENSCYTCVVVLLHALLKCTNNKYRDQLSEKMNSKEQVFLAKFLEVTQSIEFTKHNISEALEIAYSNKENLTDSLITDDFSNNVTPVKTKPLRRSYLQEFCESPKSQSLIYKEKEKLINKLTEDYKNECEENDKLADKIKQLDNLNNKLSTKLEDKDKLIKCLKDEIEELSKPKELPVADKVLNKLQMTKFHQDIFDLEKSVAELKLQISEMEISQTNLQNQLQKKISENKILSSEFDKIETEKIELEKSIETYKNNIFEKDREITSLKDEIHSKILSKSPMSNSYSNEASLANSNTLFDELKCLKLEEVTKDKEKFKQKYKTTKRDLLNTENQLQELNSKITKLKQQLETNETNHKDLINDCSNKKKVLQESRKKIISLETKNNCLKNCIKDKENVIKSVYTQLNEKESKIKDLLIEMEIIKKSKTMIELILTKTNTEIEELHEENNKQVTDLLVSIENFKVSENKLSQKILELENNITDLKKDLESRGNQITLYENKLSENCQILSVKEEQLGMVYQEKVVTENQLKNLSEKIDAQEKLSKSKILEMENYLEYYIEELENSTKKILNLEKTLDGKQKNLDIQMKSNSDQKEVINLLESEKFTLNKEVSKLNHDLIAKTNEIKKLEKNITQHVSALNEKQKELENIVTLNNNNIDVISILTKEKLSVEYDLKVALENILNQEIIIKSLQEKLFAKEMDYDNLMKIHNSKVKEIKKLDEELQLVTKNMENMKDMYNEQLIKAEKCLEISENKLKMQESALESLECTLHEKNTDMEKKVDLLKKLKENINSLEVQRCDLEEKLVGIEKILLTKESEVTNLENNIFDKNIHIKNLEEQLGVMSIEKVMLETNLNETVDQIKSSREDFTKQVNEMVKQLNERAEEIGCLKNHSSNLELLLQERKVELDDQISLSLEQIEISKMLKMEKEQLDSQIIDYNKCVATMKNELKCQEDKIYKIEMTSQNLKEQLNIVSLEKLNLENNLKSNVEDYDEKIRDLNDALDNLKKALTEKECELRIKESDFECIKEENNNLKATVNYFENQCSKLQDNITELNGYLEQKDSYIECLKNDLSENTCSKAIIEQQLVKVHEALNIKSIELNKQIQLLEEQKETFKKISQEKEDISNKLNSVENSLSHKEYEFNLSEGKLYDCSVTINNLEKDLFNMNNEKSSLELQLNEIKNQLINTKEELNQQFDIQSQLNCKQEDTCKEIKLLNEKLKEMESLKLKINNLTFENGRLNSSLVEKDSIIVDIEKIISEQEKNIREIKAEKIFLQSEIEELKAILEIKQQESFKDCENINKELLDIKDQFKEKQTEFNEQLKKLASCDYLIAELNSEKKNLLKEINSLKHTLSDKDLVIVANKTKIQEYEHSFDSLTNEKESLFDNLSRCNIELENTRNNLMLQIDEMTNRLYSLEEKLTIEKTNMAFRTKELEEKDNLIAILTSEKDNFCNEINHLKNSLAKKDYDLSINVEKLNNNEKKIIELLNLKEYLELQLKENENVHHEMKEKLEVSYKNLNEIKQPYIDLQLELVKQKVQSDEQESLITSLKNEKKLLRDDIKLINETLLQRDTELCKLKVDINYFKNKNIAFINELNMLKSLLKSLQQEAVQLFSFVESKLNYIEKQFSLQLSKVMKQIEIKQSTLCVMKQEVNYLKEAKDNLKLFLQNKKEEFEKYMLDFLSLSTNTVKIEPIEVDHQNSLMEVITSADTFIEQNGIQLGLLGNLNEYSIIERLKKLFEALKMFIININTQSSLRAITQTDGQPITDEAYIELLAKSKIQHEKIKNLENEMLKLKTECNYKMTKVQQKTQEYVTSEYEKKFERKREQMKQFCKDLETKIHQDYEAKLLKYKEKINKDEIHIKELGQQLWEVSEKYLKLQQKERRESTASLPFDILSNVSNLSSVSKYNSNTLPKSSSVGHIKSLVDESTQLSQNKRNVPTGIGKIFPKEEDEEGEMFNHSCLADLKQGRVKLNDNNGKSHAERLSELQARNSLCPPHLRSCYAVETNYLPNASLITEEDIKTTTNYSDNECENLIPNDRKKKDRNQTSYKKPGPPTPSKNGGRVSLSGNGKSSLKETKESNSNSRRRASSTPNKLFSLFMSKK
ncbi:golgin subfamily B member 1-like isoform X2 [Daktulosphaira vitifoliae]|uniref:golgin subfamily B member 1-like isoform X2 n=1 Tax=Daktulosphaira vitifoliae TaxID=58002 RepID=UPI0021AA2A76|nr:golgin subfamily B member 1-like isoform X2 [Daktulosphaira vitifoliae]